MACPFLRLIRCSEGLRATAPLSHEVFPSRLSGHPIPTATVAHTPSSRGISPYNRCGCALGWREKIPKERSRCADLLERRFVGVVGNASGQSVRENTLQSGSSSSNCVCQEGSKTGSSSRCGGSLSSIAQAGALLTPRPRRAGAFLRKWGNPLPPSLATKPAECGTAPCRFFPHQKLQERGTV